MRVGDKASRVTSRYVIRHVHTKKGLSHDGLFGLSYAL